MIEYIEHYKRNPDKNLEEFIKFNNLLPHCIRKCSTANCPNLICTNCINKSCPSCNNDLFDKPTGVGPKATGAEPKPTK